MEGETTVSSLKDLKETGLDEIRAEDLVNTFVWLPAPGKSRESINRLTSAKIILMGRKRNKNEDLINYLFN
jgi:hypothetical protein